MSYGNCAPDVNKMMYLQQVKLTQYFQSIRWPLTTISTLGLNYYENSPKKGKEKHTSETINKIKPNVILKDFFSMIF